MSHLLVTRFSALGDVAMTIPVIYSFARQYPDIEITFLTRKNLEHMFCNAPANIHFKGVNLDNYKGLRGMKRLYKELKAESYDYVADLHDVLRTQYLRFRFSLSGVPTAHIDKGRKEKKQLTRKRNKILKPLDSSFVRYKKVLEKLGFQFDLGFKSIYSEQQPDESVFSHLTGEKGKEKWLAVAPFAKHKGKIYPLDLQEQVIGALSKKENLRIFLFGGGKSEKQIVSEWKEKYPEITSVIGKLNMEQELALLSCMDLALSMDSANMHLSSLVNIPVFSVWGATHPYAGFMGWNQPEDNAIQTDLECRPCSVFGNKPCYRGDYACMYDIQPKSIVEKITAFLELNQTNSF